MQFWPEKRLSSQLGHVYSCLCLNFVHTELTSNRWGGLIDMPVKCWKRLHFWQMILFVVFFSLVLARDTWPIIE